MESANGPVIGNFGAANSLMISNGGCVVGLRGSVGWFASSSNNAVLITGSGSVWSNSGGLNIGNTGFGNRVVISEGGKLLESGGSAVVGNASSSSNNSVLVTGTGSAWENSGSITIGSGGNGTSLVISNGGRVANASAEVGRGSWTNSAVVTGVGSVWSNSGTLSIGPGKESDNNLFISDGGKVLSAYGVLASPRNHVFVSGADSVWSNQYDLSVGSYGRENSLIVSNSARVIVGGTSAIGSSIGDGNRVCVVNNALWQSSSLIVGRSGSSNSLVIVDGFVSATNVLVGVSSPSCANWVQLDSGSVTVTNATADAVFEVRNGMFIFNGGMLQVDRFVMTNACAQFVHTGGTLIYSEAVLDPDRDDDGDGVPNGWEQTLGRDPLNAADVNADTDGDGQSDLAEFQAGTDPTNSASAFRIAEIAPVDEDMLLTWKAVGGKWYVVQTATNITGSLSDDFYDFDWEIQAPGAGEYPLSVIYPGAATNAPVRFYRVRLVP